MTALHTAMNRLFAFLGVLDAAISASAAVRAHRVPAERDLRLLGIDSRAPAVAAMARY